MVIWDLIIRRTRTRVNTDVNKHRRYGGAANIREGERIAGGESSKGGADELKMGCLVSSSLQRKISIRVIRGSAAWHEGTQRIPGPSCTVSAAVRTAAQAPLFNFH